MGKILINSGGGGQYSDELTALLSDVIKDKTAVTNDSDDDIGTGTLELTGNSSIGDVLKGTTFYNTDAHNKLTGTLELTGNATVGYVYPGKTFYNTNAKSKLTGTLTVNSISNFSVSAYSGRRVLATWKNPTTATGKPYSGVYIRYSTSGYPGKTGGTQIYKGAGNNTSSGGSSSAYLDMPNLSTTYYFSIYPYVTCSAGELTGSALNASRATSGQTSKTFIGAQTYTIPAGYTRMDVFCVGGGGKGGRGYRSVYYAEGGGGGGGGRTSTVQNIAISSGQVLNIVVGAGSSSYGTNGGTSSVSRSGSTLCSANGGNSCTTDSYSSRGCNGGSGGGSGAWYDSPDYVRAGAGGSDGSDGTRGNYVGGDGQGTTTRAFGESSGTLYSGGGGGAGADVSAADGAAGGAGGGGAGGRTEANGVAGGTNTGGGGGGGGGNIASSGARGEGGNGGSGIVLIRLY